MHVITIVYNCANRETFYTLTVMQKIIAGPMGSAQQLEGLHCPTFVSCMRINLWPFIVVIVIDNVKMILLRLPLLSMCLISENIE